MTSVAAACRRPGRPVLLCSLTMAVLLCALLSGFARAQGGGGEPPAGPVGFAALDIVPTGEQIYDITSGRTELPTGGEVIDHATGIRMVAPYIVFLEGQNVEANDVIVTGSFGTFSAAALAIDIPGALLTASGDILLERDNLAVSASGLVYDATTEIAAFTGPVTGSAPDFEAAGLLLDTIGGTVLLLGPYRFQNGPLTLVSSREEGRLELIFDLIDGVPTYSAATEVSADTLERFADHLR